ncbi:hypothetical protein ABVT39_004167 [Epinephelus coioides]
MIGRSLKHVTPSAGPVGHCSKDIQCFVDLQNTDRLIDTKEMERAGINLQRRAPIMRSDNIDCLTPCDRAA